jgi:predicted secreted hydrolase
LPTNRDIQVELVPRPVVEIGARDPTGYERASDTRAISFPDDFGSHPDYQTEWWYYTGNLDTEDDRHFGYQLTFFRRALIPPADRQPRSSKWASDQVYLAHFAITDVVNNRHQCL